MRGEFHDFMSALFTTAEARGRDASGFAVWRGDHLISERRPIPAQDLVQRSNKWRSLIYNPGELYICHTRSATEGDPNDIVNNHPHFGRFMVMIHNGGVSSWRKIIKEEKISLDTDCDSEVLLRLMEQRASGKNGMKHLMTTMEKPGNNGGYAIAAIDRRKPSEILLGREHSKPLFVFPCKKFNVTFFASTLAVFEDAIKYMYGTSKWRSSLCEKEEKCDPFHLYILKKDGTYTKERLLETNYRTTTVYQGGYSHHRADPKRLVDNCKMRCTIVGGKEFDFDIRGNLIEIVSVGESGSEDNIYGSVPEMPPKVERNLVEFCQGVTEWNF
jgi:glucosamine 6-phosphate synthetase-like amidotransferase/phosphosugar isomerase protein